MPTTNLRSPLAAALVAVTLVIAACSDSGNTESADTPAAAESTPSSVLATTAPATTVPATTAPATTAPATTVPATTAPAAALLAAGAELVIQEGGLFAVDATTGERREIGADVAGGREHPDWSPDGTQIVFDTDFVQLWTTPADGASATELVFDCVAPCVNAYEGAWSPDGSEIAFAMAATDDGVHTARASIEVLDVTSGATRTAYEDDSGVVWLFQPRWSPDGTAIVFDEATFASNRLDEGEIIAERIATVASDGSATEPRYLTPADGAATTPDWSPAGDLIVFVRGDNLVTINPDGSGETQITDFDGTSEHAIQPTFLPAGNGIVFTYVTGRFDVDDEPSAATVALDGANLTVLPLGRATHPRANPAS